MDGRDKPGHDDSAKSQPIRSPKIPLSRNSVALTRFLHVNQAMVALETATVPRLGASVFLANRSAARYQVHAFSRLGSPQ
jgi:hypothetical protein